MTMIPSSAVKIICKVLDNEKAPETFESYTIDSTSFYFSLSWSENFTNRSFYSNDFGKIDLPIPYGQVTK